MAKVHKGDLVVTSGHHVFDYAEITGDVWASDSGSVSLPVATTIGDIHAARADFLSRGFDWSDGILSLIVRQRGAGHDDFARFVAKGAA